MLRSAATCTGGVYYDVTYGTYSYKNDTGDMTVYGRKIFQMAAGTNWRGFATARIAKPSIVMFAADSYQNTDTKEYAWVNPRNSTTAASVVLRHSDGANLLMGDGHVARFTKAEIRPIFLEMINTTTFYVWDANLVKTSL